MKYAVQYAYEGLGIQIPIDTAPISKDEALKLFYDNLDDFRSKLSNGMEPTLVIWEDVGDGEFPVYSRELVLLDRDTEIDGKQFYVTKREQIELPQLQTNQE